MKKTSLKNQNIITGNKSNTKNILVGVGIVILLYVLAHILWSTFPFLFKPAFQVTAPFSSQMIEECNSFNDEGSRKICLLDLAKRIRNPEPCKWLTIENDMVQCLRSTILINSLKVTADLSENTCATFPESTKEDCFIVFVSNLYDINLVYSSNAYALRGNITLSQKICARAPDPYRCEIMAVVDWAHHMPHLKMDNLNFTEVLTGSNFSVTQLNSSVCEEIITYQEESDRCYEYSVRYFGSVADWTRNSEVCQWINKSREYIISGMSACLQKRTNPSIVTADLSENTCATFPESTKEDCFIAFVSILPENSFYNYYSSSHNYSIRGSNITLSQKICARAPDPRRCEIMAVVDWIDEMGGKVKNNFNFTKSLTESLTDSNFTVTQLNSSVCEEIITYRKESDRCYGYSINYFGQDLKLCDKIQDKQDKPPSCYVQ